MNSFYRSIFARSLMTGAASLVFMVAGAAGVCAQTVIGANGEDGADCFTDFCTGGNGTEGDSVTAEGTAIGGSGGNGGNAYVSDGPYFYGTGGNGGNGGSASASGAAFGGAGGAAGNFLYNGSGGLGGNGGNAIANSSGSVTATGGAGGEGIDDPFIEGSGAGGNATATSITTANGFGNAISSAMATGGGTDGQFLVGGSATAASSATTNGSGSATATATATTGNGAYYGAANATSNATTKNGALAQAQAQAQAQTGFGSSQSTAKTTFGGVSVQSTVELFGGGSTEATAQGGSGQSPVNPGFEGLAFATALPNAAYATTLIGSANNVADALLGPDDKIFGTAILEGSGGSSTFDFSYRGDLILGVIDGEADIVVNGLDVTPTDMRDDTVFDLGSFGSNIDLTINGSGEFVIGGAVPEPSTWAMMLLGFVGLGYAGHRARRSDFAA